MALENTPNWPWIILGMAFLLALAIAGYAAQRQKPTSGLNASKMKFVWNEDERVLKSQDPDIYVRVFGPGREPYSDYVLYVGKRRIGFTTEAPAYRTDDGRRIWVLSSVATYVSRGGSRGTIYAHQTLFEDKAEQDRMIALIEAALQNFDWSAPDIHNVNSVVKYTDRLRRQIDSGKLIKQART